MTQPEPNKEYAKVQVKYDAETARILELTAKRIRARIARAGTGIGGQIRKAQLTATLNAVVTMLNAMWSTIDATLDAGVDAGTEAAEDAIEAMTRVAYAALSPQVAETLVNGLRASAESGLKSDKARRKRELSKRVYNQRDLSQGKVEETIRAGLISSLSARELANDVYGFVSPTTPGGASYAAMRLARTEINNAFHERQLEGAKRPGVSAVKWNLSGSHRVPDECNVYAAHNGDGVWPVDGVPEKPHPQCFCYLTYETIKSDDFVKALESGSFDDEIDRRTKLNMARLGQSVGSVKSSVEPPTGEIKSFIQVRTRNDPKEFDAEYFPRDVARRFSVSESEAKSYIEWVKTNPRMDTLRKTEANKTYRDLSGTQAKDKYGKIKLNSPEAEAIYAYSTDAYFDINDFWRGNKPDELSVAEVKKLSRAIDSTMTPFTEDIRLYRRTGYDSLGDLNARSDLTKLVGKVFQDKGYMSTTVDKANDAMGPDSGPIALTIQAPKGAKGVYIDEISGNRGEKEMLLARGSKYRVVSATRAGNGWNLVVDLLI